MATISLRNINPARFDYNVYMMSNVGIGTTSPTNKLHVEGSALFEYPAVISSQTNSQLILTDSDTPAMRLNVMVDKTAAASGAVALQSTESGVSNDRALLLNPHGGKVGIGTASPAYQVDIENSSNAVLRLHAGTNASASVRLKNDAQDWDVNCQVTDKFAIYNQTAGVQAFTIDTSNNVGIGTTSPTVKLDVVGGISLQSNNNLTWGNATYAAGVPTIVGVTGSGFYFHPNGSTSGTTLRILANGNVGIGTGSNTPAAKLHIANSDAQAKPTQLLIENTADGGAGIQFKNTDYASTLWQLFLADDSSGLKIGRDGSDYLLVADGGNVGIGTSTPATNLHVDTTGTDARIRVSAGTNTVQGGMIANSSTSLVYAGSITNHGFSLRTNDEDRVRIDTSGNVGIGTSSPAYKLDVNGTVRCNTLIFADGTSFSSVGQVGMKAIAVNIGNGSSNIVARAQSIVNASYGGIQNGMVVVYYHWYYTYGCGNGTCGATAHRRAFYQVVNGTWTLHFTSG